ncbi:FAD-linked oxidoreductase [Hypoxylon sp. EC38]|nr:FAD-linked oxidoreductase [Hypoxylon sp. EC38]
MSTFLRKTSQIPRVGIISIPRISSTPKIIIRSSHQRARQFTWASRGVQQDVFAAPKPPLSVLPTSVLIRSLLVSTVSSKPYLLRPSLSALSYLARPERIWLLNVDRNPLLHWILKRTFYAQFCAGENRQEVQALGKQMKSMGITGILLTYAKETVFNSRDGTEQGMGTSAQKEGASARCAGIEAWRVGTLETVSMLGEGDQIALKLTGAGPFATKHFAAGELPPRQMIDALDDICQACKKLNARVVVDAESQHYQKGIARTTIELMRKYNRDGYALVFNTYQAYLKRTPERVAQHLALSSKEGWTLGLKLVRGAYMATDERSLIHDTKEETDTAYNYIAQNVLRLDKGLVAGSESFPSVNLLLATHNKNSALEALRLHRERVAAGLPTVPIQFAQLHGMSDDVTFSLLQSKDDYGESPKVLKCTTWGTLGECMAYLLRRALENRDAVSRTKDEYLALRKELRRRLRFI